MEIAEEQKGRKAMRTEAEEQQSIRSLIDHEDQALSRGDFGSMFAHYSPEYVESIGGKITDLAGAREMWAKAHRFMDTTSKSEITDFVLTKNRADVSYTSYQITRLKNMKFFSGILIVTEEFYRSEWVNTPNGWLCRKSQHLRTRFRSMKWQKMRGGLPHKA